ncbi:ATP-binding protein [Streptomyces bauhiniae]|uniref:ATP-binding protein n=1 Tax=Streptomyces bauhiniae TaxID=2340725 RepID=UPI0033B0090F
METTTRACARIVLSATDIDRWPDASDIRLPAAAKCRSRSLTVYFPAMDRAVPICRHLSGLWLEGQGLADRDVRYTTLLVTTELATNAVLHTDSTVIIASLRRNRTHLRVQVRDQGRTATEKHWHKVPGFGRGLGIVAGCTREFGTHVDDDGARTIWATVALTAG